MYLSDANHIISKEAIGSYLHIYLIIETVMVTRIILYFDDEPRITQGFMPHCCE